MVVNKLFVNPVSGKLTQATEEQLQNEPTQILCICGIEALWHPEIWVGEYNGQMIFYPCHFQSLGGNNILDIRINDVIISSIENNSYLNYRISYKSSNGVIRHLEGTKLYELFSAVATF